MRRAEDMMSKSMILVVVVAVSVAGCATAPKPSELEALEVLRGGKTFKLAQKKHQKLISEGEDAYKKSVEAWEGNELEDAKHWALIGSIKLRTAFAMIEQQQQKLVLSGGSKKLRAAQEQHQKLLSQIEEAEEKIELYGKLAKARATTKQREAALSEAQKKAEAERQLGEAQKKVGDAQLALKLADTVEAAKHAKHLYALAQELLNKATAALSAGNAVVATTSATMAKAKAEAAHAAATVHYNKAKEAASRQARNQALQRDAAAIAGVTVKLKAVGQTQQLVLPVINLFKRRKTQPRDDKVGILNSVGQLLKKYPDYPVIINGYTSYRVRRSQRYAMSQSRAQRVASHFVTMGLPLKRFAVAGRGVESLIARRYSSINDRVEIIILFQ